MKYLWHLVKRTFQSLNNRALSDDEVSIALGVLSTAEWTLWNQMQNRDKRHSIVVLQRFDLLVPGATIPERRAALLHDIGKVSSDIGIVGRILATVHGPKTKAMTCYLDHENIGYQMLQGVSDARTLEVLSMADSDIVAKQLRRADDL